MTLPEEAVARVLDEWPVARLATLGPGGAPQAVPIVFARLGGALWSAIDGKPKAAREPARVRNVRRDPRVCLLLDEYGPDWEALWWVRVTAHARVVEGPGHAAEIDAAVRGLAAKYPQYASVAVLREPATLLAFEIRGTRSWCAGDPDRLLRPKVLV